MSAAMEWVIADQRQSSSRWHLTQVQIPERPVTTSASPMLPDWASPVVRRLTDLLSLRDNWDSYGAVKPSTTSAVELFKVLIAVANPDTPAPSIVPSPLGHFQAEWHLNGADLEVEVVTPTKIIVSFSDGSDAWEEELDVDVTRLAQAVRRIGRAP
jgi:hypothetical protein